MAGTEMTVVVGGGQAGLTTSALLSGLGCEHVILEKAPYVGSVWRDQRWDSFTFATPNHTFVLPGATYAGDEPEGFLTRAEIVEGIDHCAATIQAPLRLGIAVNSIAPQSDGSWQVLTSDGAIAAANVVMATGLFQRPKLPDFAPSIAPRVEQLHCMHYRHPGQLPPGAVLVVGSAQSGGQIAEELYKSGRRVFLALGGAGRAPRRYRGKDIFSWLLESGFMERTTDQLPSPRAKFAGNPHVSGAQGGHTLNLHQFARDGVVLLGRLLGGDGAHLHFAANRNESLARADAFEKTIVAFVDAYIARAGIDAPPESPPTLDDGFAQPELSELDLDAAGITSILWAAGFGFDFDIVHAPVFDSDGYPVHQGGATPAPGLYFVGLPWLTKYKSGLMVGVGEDAARVAQSIAARRH
ncbi:MAG: flavin-containing monooxygenase [Caldilineaceae bacterium]